MYMIGLIFNFSYLNYHYYLVHEPYIKKAIVILGYCLVAISTALNVIYILLPSFTSIKKFFKRSILSIIIEVISVISLFFIIFFYRIDHRAVDFINGILFLPLLICSFLYENIKYEPCHLVLAYISIILTNIYHSALLDIIFGINESDRCIWNDIIIFLIIPIQVITL